MLHAVEDAREHHADAAQPDLVGHVDDRAAAAHDAGVVVREVEAAEGVDGLRDHRGDGGGVGDVDADGEGRAAGLFDQGDGLLRVIEVDVGDGDRRTGAGELDRGRAADAAGGAGHEGDAAGEVVFGHG